MAIAEVTVLPMGTATPSVSQYIADVHRVLEAYEGKIKYRLTPMSTILEGELDDIFEVVKRMHEVPFHKGVLRVNTALRIDERRDKSASMEQKIRSVEEKLQS